MKDTGAAAEERTDSGRTRRTQRTREGSDEPGSGDEGGARAQGDDAQGDGQDGSSYKGEASRGEAGATKKEGAGEGGKDRVEGSVSIEWEVDPEAVEAMGARHDAAGADEGEAEDVEGAEEMAGAGWGDDGDDGRGGEGDGDDAQKEESKRGKGKSRGDAWERFGGWRSSRREKKGSEKRGSEKRGSDKKTSDKKTSDKKTSEKKTSGNHDGAFARGRGFVEGMVPDSVKKLFVAGLGALFTGEEGARRVAADLSLPKDAASFLLTQVQSTKRELFRIVAGEIRDFLENVNLGAELQRILTSLTFEVKMQIRLKPSEDDNGVRPQVKGKVRVVPKKERSKNREKKSDKKRSRDES